MSLLSLARRPMCRAAAALLVALASQAASAAGWVVHLLPTLGGAAGAATGINAQGDISGNAATADGVLHPVRWRDGHVKQLSDAEGDALDINDKGAIVMRLGALTYLWRPAQAPLFMGELSYPHQINNHGTMAGSAGNGDAAIFTKTTLTRVVGLPGNYLSYCSHVNDHGVIVGASLVNPGMEPTLWKNNGEILQLPVLGSFGWASSLNLHGTIVGTTWDWDQAHTQRAVRWQHLQPIALPSPFTAAANAVNESDEIVGWRATAGGHSRAAYWKDDQLTDLDEALSWLQKQAGWHLVEATDINDDGAIVGQARNAKTGETRAFLATH